MATRVDRSAIVSEVAFMTCRTQVTERPGAAIGREGYVEGDAMEGINLDGFLRANESQIRWQVESLVLDQVTRAIGRDNLGKVTLIFEGSALDDLAVHVEGPDDLKSKIEAALCKN